MPEIVKKRIERMLDNDKEGVEAKWVERKKHLY
jgi:hypothetical protein